MPRSNNLCLRKSVKNPNKCKKVKGCKVAKGPKRTYCRKTHNKKSSKRKTSKRKTAKRRSEVSRLKGHNKSQVRALRKLR
jgi:hypothetical protein